MLVFSILVYLIGTFCKTQLLRHHTTFKCLSHSSRKVLSRAHQVVLAEPTIDINTLPVLNEVELGVPLANSSFDQSGNKAVYHNSKTEQPVSPSLI